MSDDRAGRDGKSRLRIKIELGDVVVEIVSIVVAILLALGVNTWQARIHRRAVLRNNVANIVAEIRRNARLLAPLERKHVAVDRRLQSVYLRAGNSEAVSSGRFMAVLQRAAPTGLGVLQIQDIAWQIAQQDNALALMPYEQRAQLTALYARQQDLRANYSRTLNAIEGLSSRNAYFTLRATVLSFGDVVAAEADLMRDYGPLASELTRAYAIPPQKPRLAPGVRSSPR